MPVGGGEERRVLLHLAGALVRYPDWSPSSDWIAYEFAESTSTVWVTELPQAGAPR